MEIKPLVSICSITYNHAPYIKDCLDGMLMQRTKFLIEILIHDDASTDGTANIIRDYAAKYPEIVKPIFEQENQWNKGRRGSMVFNFPRAQGKYIALCEGDDYWIDPYKLQKQVDFLKANPEFGMVYSDYYTLTNGNYNRNSEIDTFKTHYEENAAPEIISDSVQRIGTATVLLRKDLVNHIYDDYSADFNSGPGDNVLWFHIARKSKIKYLDMVTAVYRKNDGGVTATNDTVKRYNFLKNVHYQKKYLARKYNYNEIIDRIDEKYIPNLFLTSYILGEKGEAWEYFRSLLRIQVKWKLLKMSFIILKLVRLKIRSFLNVRVTNYDVE